jgi:hypothetical protein
MNFPEFENILNNLSLVTRVRFKNVGEATLFSVIRSFEGWILIDGTGDINFRFTAFDADPADRGVVNLRFSPYPTSDGAPMFYIGAVHIGGISEVDFV